MSKASQMQSVRPTIAAGRTIDFRARDFGVVTLPVRGAATLFLCPKCPLWRQYFSSVAVGLVASLNRPGGNVTGISFLADSLAAKHVEILHEILPGAGPLGLIVNPSNANADPDVREAQAAAQKVGFGLVVLKASTPSDLEAAFAKCAREKVAGLLVLTDPALNNQRELLTGLAARYALPAIYAIREFPDAGGLMSYGASITGAFREMERYAGRILRGVKPSDLPVQQATRLELVINLKTARSLGLTIPLSLLGRADEVIE
jgi:putative tryptophan/tyrosine transport system substrate-binding protein